MTPTALIFTLKLSQTLLKHNDQKSILNTPIFFKNPLLVFTSMEALCLNHVFHYKNGPFQHLKSRSRSCRPRVLVVSSCQNDEHMERSTRKKQNKEKGELPFSGIFSCVQKFGRGLKENMSPKQKGDWKDLMLMSLSFAVYVYMSQMLVCAYCAWMSMPKPSW